MIPFKTQPVVKIKLPRKRKKVMIKESGEINYLAFTIIHEILRAEGKPKDKWYRYKKLQVINNEVVTVKYY